MKTIHNFTKVHLSLYVHMSTSRYSAGDIRQVEIRLLVKLQFSIFAV